MSWWEILKSEPEALDLRGVGLENKDLKRLKKASFVKRLDLSQNPQISGGLAALSDLPLESLSLDGCYRFTAAGLKPIGKLSSLKTLSLAGCGANKATAKLVGGLTELESLDLSWDIPVILARGVRGAWTNPPFSEGIEGAGVHRIRGLTRLKHLAVRHHFFWSLVPRLSKLPSLESLDISYCSGDPEGNREPFGKLKNLKKVVARGAAGTTIGGLLVEVEKMTALEYLDLEGAEVHPSTLSHLGKGASLRFLRLPSSLSQEQVDPVREALAQCEIEHQAVAGYVALRLSEEGSRHGLHANHRTVFRQLEYRRGQSPPPIIVPLHNPSLELVRKWDDRLDQRCVEVVLRSSPEEAEANAIEVEALFS